MQDFTYLKNLSQQIRRDILRMVHGCQSGHPGGSLGCVEFFVSLYQGGIMNHNPDFKMDGKGEDVFILSNGHISPVWYSTLARSGYFPINELSTFRKLNSRLQGHPTTHEGLSGIRIASGSLGQGLSVACGISLSKRLEKDNSFVFTLCGDGELQEGQIWEAAMFASHNNLQNLILTVDWNGQQIDGPNDKVLSLGDLELKWKSFGWNVIVNEDGNDIQKVIEHLMIAKSIQNQKPTAILMKTQMGSGVDFMTGTHEWHGKAPNDQQLQKALEQLQETVGDY
jgi:transketolase